MNVEWQSYEILSNFDGIDILKQIEIAARTCYKSEDKITEDSYLRMVKKLINSQHDAMLEHGGVISVKFYVDRAIANETVRHRIASFAQESTRYVNYGKKELSFIIPPFTNEKSIALWENLCQQSENTYLQLLALDEFPEIARCCLLLSTKSAIVVTANIREWRHIFKLRTDKTAHPQMREIMISLCRELSTKIPIVFDDILEAS